MRLISTRFEPPEPDAAPGEAIPARNPFRCFNAAYLRNTAALAVAVVLLAYVGRQFVRGSAPRLVIGAAQALLVAWLVVYSVGRVRTLDEFLQRLHLEAIAIAFTVTGALIAAHGVLERAGAPAIAWGLWAWPLMAVLWAVAAAIRGRHYR
jgi:hypothetical protein